MPNSLLHTITVTSMPNMEEDLPDDEYIDAVQFTIDQCPGTNCRVWWECTKACADYEPTEEETDEGEYTAHGVFHQNIDGMWMTESSACALTSTDSGSDSLQEAAEKAGLGTHKIAVDYEGDGYWSVRLFEEVNR